ncbi:hypothetical protein OAT10_00255 [Luminiphilus sp.]|nr:hypothetical protein [Luminiphilus sp.]
MLLTKNFNQRIPNAIIDKIVLDTKGTALVEGDLEPGLSVELEILLKENLDIINAGILTSIDSKLEGFSSSTKLKDVIRIGVLQSTRKEMTDLIDESDCFRFLRYGLDYFYNHLALYKLKKDLRLYTGNFLKDNQALFDQIKIGNKVKDYELEKIDNIVSNLISSKRSAIVRPSREQGIKKFNCFLQTFSLNQIDITKENVTEYIDPVLKKYVFKINTGDSFKPVQGDPEAQNKNTIPAYSCRHLTYYVFAYLEDTRIKSITEQPDVFNLKANQLRNLSMTFGDINKKTVFDERDLKIYSKVLKDPDELYYSGPAHLMDGKWMSEASHDINSIELSQETRIDSRIKDFRIKNKIRNLQPSNYALKFDKTSNPISKSYFTDLMISHDHYGNISLMFGIDVSKTSEDSILKNYCAFPKMLSRIPGDVRKYFKIKKLDVYRRRVVEDSYNKVQTRIANNRFKNKSGKSEVTFTSKVASSGMKELTPFNKNNPEEIFVCSITGGQKYNTNSFEASRTGDNEFSERRDINKNTNLNTIRRINVNPFFNISADTPYVYTVVDTSLKYGNVGNWQYIVELELEDSSIKLMKEVFQNLINLKVDFENYRSVLRAEGVGEYNFLINKYGTTAVANRKLHADRCLNHLATIDAYLKILFDVNFNSLIQIPESGMKIIASMVHYQTNAPDNLEPIIDVIEFMISFIREKLGFRSESLEKSTSLAGNATGFPEPTSNFTKIKNYFINDTASPDEYSYPGVEYILADDIGNYGKRFIEGMNLKEREGLTNTNRFDGSKVVNSELIAERLSSGVSPDLIDMPSSEGDGVVDMRSNINQSYRNYSAVEILNFNRNTTDSQPYSLRELTVTDLGGVKDQSDIMSSDISKVNFMDSISRLLSTDAGCSIRFVSDTSRRRTNEQELETLSTETANTPFGEIFDASSEESDEDSYSSSNIINDTNIVSGRPLTGASFSSDDRSIRSVKNNLDAQVSMMTQLMGTLYSDNSPTSREMEDFGIEGGVIDADATSLETLLNTSLAHENVDIKFLFGFEGGRFKNPIWLSLEENILTSLTSSGKDYELICKIDKLESANESQDVYNLPIYNRFFIIQSGDYNRQRAERMLDSNTGGTTISSIIDRSSSSVNQMRNHIAEINRSKVDVKYYDPIHFIHRSPLRLTTTLQEMNQKTASVTTTTPEEPSMQEQRDFVLDNQRDAAVTTQREESVRSQIGANQRESASPRRAGGSQRY